MHKPKYKKKDEHIKQKCYIRSSDGHLTLRHKLQPTVSRTHFKRT